MRAAAVVAALLALALFAGPVASAGAADRIIDGSASSHRLGAYDPAKRPAIAAARTQFGAPDGLRGDDNACSGYWNRIGLKIVFANFGGGGACGSAGRAQVAYVRGSRGRALWRTGKGLRVGSTLARLRALYPRARRHGSSYWLTSAYSFIAQGVSPILSAKVDGGKVTYLKLWIGAAGD